MEYRQALDKLLSLTDLERVSGRTQSGGRYNLDRIGLLLERMDNPHLKTPTVHITGTKGKGSTAAMITSVLAAQGYTPGLFTSPHLHTFRERIQLNGAPISEAEFAALLEAVWPEIEAVNSKDSVGEVTTFELLTAMAFLHFHRQRAGFQVIEVGLGGRLDSTNLVQPQLSVITSISLDHTRILGDTLEKIAFEKAGIIKQETPVVTSPQKEEAMGVLRDVARARHAPLVSAGEECQATRVSHFLEGQTIDVLSPRGKFRLRIPLLGEHQVENAVTALVSLQVLNEAGFAVSGDSISRGFDSIAWPCRMEVLSREPLLIADGAHNPYSAGILRRGLEDYLDYRRLIYVVGLSNDKNIEGIVAELAQNASLVITAKSRHPRAVSPEEVAGLFAQHGVEAVASNNVADAVKLALSQAGEGDLIVAAGSLFVAAEAREAVLGIPPEIYPALRRDMSSAHAP